MKEQGFIIDFVGWIFSDVLTYILFTPFDMFRSVTAVSVLIKMGLFSSGLVTLLAMIEGIKRSLSLNYTPMAQILCRYPIALFASAVAPFLFYYAGMGTNELVKIMGLITHSSIQGVDYFTSTLQGIGEHVMEAVLMFVFLIIMTYYMCRVLLYHASRWFGLLFNMVTTPVVMTAYMFKSYESIAKGWFKDTVHKFLVVVVHSFFLGLIGVLLYSPTTQWISDNVSAFGYAMVKVMFAIGGLQMMLRPPSWISGGFDDSQTRASARPLVQLFNRIKPGGGR